MESALSTTPATLDDSPEEARETTTSFNFRGTTATGRGISYYVEAATSEEAEQMLAAAKIQIDAIWPRVIQKGKAPSGRARRDRLFATPTWRTHRGRRADDLSAQKFRARQLQSLAQRGSLRGRRNSDTNRPRFSHRLRPPT